MIFGKFAVVINNSDPEQKGRVKLRPLPEFTGVAESLLDWSYPYTLDGGGCVGGGEHNPPEIGEMVKIVIRDKYWKRIEYISGDYIEDAYPYTNFSSILTSMTELGNQTYPQPKYIKEYKDGSYYFHNSETGESGQYNSNGSYIIFDTTGKVIIHGHNKDIIIDGASSGKVHIKNSSATLHTILKEVITVLQNVITPGNLVGNTGAPVLYALAATDVTKIVTNLTNLSLLLDD